MYSNLTALTFSTSDDGRILPKHAALCKYVRDVMTSDSYVVCFMNNRYRVGDNVFKDNNVTLRMNMM